MERRNSRFARLAGTAMACVVAFAIGTFGTAMAEEPDFAAPEVVPEADAHGVIVSSSWAEQYPLQYGSYLLNAENVPPEYDVFIEEGGIDTTSAGIDLLEGDFSAASEKADYLAEDQYPEIRTLGKGYGYAKYYTEPAGHTYALWSVAHNGRLGIPLTESKGKISCYACKTPQIHFDALNSDNPDYWIQPIAEHTEDFDENISCANCHQNDNPTQLQVLRAGWVRAMGDDLEDNLEGAVCGQCHCDYSMAPAVAAEDGTFAAGEPTSPYYGGLDSMTPESALAFYDEYGFSDWTYASTGAQMLAIRHAEFEFCYANGGNFMVMNMGYNCSDCHMGTKVSDEGVAYTSHHWVSPLEDEELLASCNTCHGDFAAWVEETQADIDGRTHELGLRAEQFIFNFEDVVAIEDADGNLVFDMDTALANGLTEDEVSRLQTIQREACYYWNLAAAENSEGCHNPDFYNELLDQGNALLDEADEILGVSSVVA